MILTLNICLHISGFTMCPTSQRTLCLTVWPCYLWYCKPVYTKPGEPRPRQNCSIYQTSFRDMSSCVLCGSTAPPVVCHLYTVVLHCTLSVETNDRLRHGQECVGGGILKCVVFVDCRVVKISPFLWTLKINMFLISLKY